MVNKLYVLMVLLLLSVVHSGLFLFGLLVSLVFYVRGILRARVPIAPDGTFQYQTHVYKSVGNTTLKLDVWYPNQIKPAYPLVFFAHGGGWISGLRNQPNNVSWCKFLASKGFAAASIDYRLALRSTMDHILTDYTDALHFAKANAESLRVDKDHIVLMGLSAGGHLALLYAAYYTFMNQESRMKGIKGVSVYYCPSDLRDVFVKGQKSLFARFATMAALKGMPHHNPDLGKHYRCSYIRFPTFYEDPEPGTETVQLYNFQPKEEIRASLMILHGLGSSNIKFLLWMTFYHDDPVGQPYAFGVKGGILYCSCQEKE